MKYLISRKKKKHVFLSFTYFKCKKINSCNMQELVKLLFFENKKIFFKSTIGVIFIINLTAVVKINNVPYILRICVI